MTVCLFTDDYEDELQMAAATWDDASQVRVAPPTEFVAPPQTEGEENQDQVNFYIKSSFSTRYNQKALPLLVVDIFLINFALSSGECYPGLRHS